MVNVILTGELQCIRSTNIRGNRLIIVASSDRRRVEFTRLCDFLGFVALHLYKRCVSLSDGVSIMRGLHGSFLFAVLEHGVSSDFVIFVLFCLRFILFFMVSCVLRFLK